MWQHMPHHHVEHDDPLSQPLKPKSYTTWNNFGLVLKWFCSTLCTLCPTGHILKQVQPAPLDLWDLPKEFTSSMLHCPSVAQVSIEVFMQLHLLHFSFHDRNTVLRGPVSSQVWDTRSYIFIGSVECFRWNFIVHHSVKGSVKFKYTSQATASNLFFLPIVKKKQFWMFSCLLAVPKHKCKFCT